GIIGDDPYIHATQSPGNQLQARGTAVPRVTRPDGNVAAIAPRGRRFRSPTFKSATDHDGQAALRIQLNIEYAVGVNRGCDLNRRLDGLGRPHVATKKRRQRLILNGHFSNKRPLEFEWSLRRPSIRQSHSPRDLHHVLSDSKVLGADARDGLVEITFYCDLKPIYQGRKPG